MVNYLISSNQVCIVSGEPHEVVCAREFGLTLKRFLATGGVRTHAFREHIGIESGLPLSPFQRQVIIRVLKQDDYFSLVLSGGGKWEGRNTMRPIRSL